MAKHPTSELVVWAWIATIPGITPAMVSTFLPRDSAAWHPTGYVTVGPSVPIGNTPNRYVPLRELVMEINTWGVVPNTTQPNWESAADLAELIVNAAYDNHGLNTALVMPRAGYNTARVTGAWPVTDPERQQDDIANYAKYELDLGLNWIEIPEEEI